MSKNCCCLFHKKPKINRIRGAILTYLLFWVLKGWGVEADDRHSEETFAGFCPPAQMGQAFLMETWLIWYNSWNKWGDMNKNSSYLKLYSDNILCHPHNLFYIRTLLILTANCCINATYFMDVWSRIRKGRYVTDISFGGK